MTRGRLLLYNLVYHWRGNCAVLLGVVVGTAVLTGAFLVGDSLRGSLRERTLAQLGWVDEALVAGRFIREKLADELGVAPLSPVIMLQGAAGSDAHGGERRAGRVMILGVDHRFWQPFGQSPGAPDERFWNSTAREVVLNRTLAEELGVAAGATITLNVQKVSAVPRETMLGRREAADVVDRLRVKVRQIIPDEGPGQFSLTPSVDPPRNAFVPLAMLQTELQQERRVNVLLAGAEPAGLQDNLKRHLILEDWGLALHDPAGRARELFAKLDRRHEGKLTGKEWPRQVGEAFARAADRNGDGILTLEEVEEFFRTRRNYLSLESRQMLLEPAVADAALAAARKAHLRAAPTLVYLANRLAEGNTDVPYSVVAALDPGLSPPLGPFLPKGVEWLKDDEIVLAAWKDSPLPMKAADKVTLSFFPPEEQDRFREAQAAFTLRGTIPLAGVAADPNLTPEFPGITDKLDLKNWDPPFPYDNQRVQPRDERYWDTYRTTPKAYVTLAVGQRLWGSRFGRLTSIRLAWAPPSGVSGPADLTSAAQDFRRHLLEQLRPEQGGLVFDAVRQRGLAASAGGTDFGDLFLAFSFFLIAAALLLVGLLFRLNLDRRSLELGLLLALGLRLKTIRRLLLVEGSILALSGGALGLVGAVIYARLLLELLRTWWPGALERSFLHLYVTPESLLKGYAGALVVSILTIIWAVRVLGQAAPRALLAGGTTGQADISPKTPPRWGIWVAVASGIAAIGLLSAGWFVRDHEMRTMSFFGSGLLLLIAGLAVIWAFLRRRDGGQPRRSLTALGLHNAARYPVRSLLTVGLLAAAVFLVVAVESFHKDPDKDLADTHSGSGGFVFIAESNLPIYQDLNTPRSRDQLNFQDKDARELDGVRFYSFRQRTGDDASCLNLYQPRRRRLLGVPPTLIERGGFRFQDTEARSPEERANPWLLLDHQAADGAVPVFGDANTVQWMLKNRLGGTLDVPNERGEPVTLRIVGLLADSIFQSQLLLSEASFLKLYPAQEGFEYFLLDAPADRAGQVKNLLEKVLAPQGLAVTSTAGRLESYFAVENTYLSTFQALGGLGLVLGALGLAVVLLRTVWERRGELALLRALGFRKTALGWLLFAENCFLLLLGLVVGCGTALLAVTPPLLEGQGEVPWLRLARLLGFVLLVGLGTGAIAAATSLRAPLLPALRRE